jgi:hypothetical protein
MGKYIAIIQSALSAKRWADVLLEAKVKKGAAM